MFWHDIDISFRFKSDFDLSFQHVFIIESDGGTCCGLQKSSVLEDYQPTTCALFISFHT